MRNFIIRHRIAIAVLILAGAIALAVQQMGNNAIQTSRQTTLRESYHIALVLHNSQLAGCRRSRLDRIGEVEQNQNVYEISKTLAIFLEKRGMRKEARPFHISANRAKLRQYETRLRIVDCNVAFPLPPPPPGLVISDDASTG
jgi:hypothetical protein